VFEDLQQIYGWSIDSTGNLTLMSGFPIAVPLSGIPLTTYNQYTVITNPAGTLLFISEAGNEQILVYQIGTTGSLTAATGSPFITVGLEPQNMGMDGLGKFLYVSEDSSTHSGSIVGAYSVQSSGTVLQAIAGSPFNFPLWEMQGDPSGKFLIGISGRTTFYFGSNDDTINVFNIDSTGAISPVIGSPFATTNAPFNIAVQPTTTSGALIYSLSITDTNSGANPVEGFQLDATTGALTKMAGSPFTSVMDTWGQFDPSGSFLFLNQGTSLSAFQVPSAGGLSAIGSPVAFTTLGYWAVADAQ